MNGLFTRDEIIKAVLQLLRKNKYKLSENYDIEFEPARVPIYGWKESKKKRRDEIFVDIITEDKIEAGAYFRDTKYRTVDGHTNEIEEASSGEFFRHFLNKAKVYWAIGDYAIEQEGFNTFKEKCRKHNIGLIKISQNGDGYKATFLEDCAKSLFDERFEIILDRLSSLCNKESREKLEDTIEEVLDRIFQGNLSYLVFYPSPIYRAKDISVRGGNTTISGELINKMRDLENLSYKGILHKFSDEYYSGDDRKVEEPYEIALRITKELWGIYKLKYPDLHKSFEGILRLNPKYRDHFLHAFQVFLYGCYVLDKLYSQIDKTKFEDKDGYRIEDAWLLASTYHDFAYMIQEFDTWTPKLFKETLHFEKGSNPAVMNLEKSYIQEGLMFFTKEILAEIGIKEVDNLVIEFFYDRILRLKNHGLLSALSLRKLLEKEVKSKRISMKVVKQACKAISIHDSDIYESLAGLRDPKNLKKYKDKIGKKLNEKKVIRNMSWEKDPISFLLNLADFVQEEGRVGSKYEANSAALDTIRFNEKEIYTKISFSGPSSGDALKIKNEEFEKVCEFLDGNKIFEVEIVNKARGKSISEKI